MSYLLPAVKMPADLQLMYDEFLKQLGGIQTRVDDQLLRAEQCLAICKDIMDKLKLWTTQHAFKDVQGEIMFFKLIKPRFYCQLLFYQDIFRIEEGRPAGGSMGRKYLKRKLRALRVNVEAYEGLYRYLRRGDTALDEVYFLREVMGGGPLDAIRPDGDSSFTTAQDHRVAEILKNELLLDYLADQLRLSFQAPGQGTSGEMNVPTLKWTGTLSGLYEVIYSLRHSGVINNGNVTISQLVSFFEASFGVDLKNIYRGFQELRIKKDRASLLKRLAKILEETMDAEDENPRGR